MDAPGKFYPSLADFAPAGMPEELRERPQHVAWELRRRGDTPTKVPINPKTGWLASSTDPATWATFEEAFAFARSNDCNGTGYVFAPYDPFAGVDLDGCRDADTGAIEAWALEIVRRLNSYAEISPSGTGIKIFVRGELPPGRRRKGNVEAYDRARYYTITGWRLPSAPAVLEDRTQELLAFHRDVFGDQGPHRVIAQRNQHPEGTGLDDEEVLAKALAASHAGKFARLWGGSIEGYRSHSEADLALCSMLAFWLGADEERIDSLFRSSGLYRDKWEREDYRRRTLHLALQGRISDDDGSYRRGSGRATVYARRKGGVSLG